MSFADSRGDLRSCLSSTREIRDAGCLKHGSLPGCYRPDYPGPVGPGTRVSVASKREESNRLAVLFRLKSLTRSCPLCLKRRGSGQLIQRCSARPEDRRELFRRRGPWRCQCSVRKQRVSLIRASKETRDAELPTRSIETGGVHNVRDTT